MPGEGTLLGQEADPFYLNLLNQGERSLLEGNYRKAIDELEIAVFGLTKETRLEAKAYVYMSLSYFHLNDLEQSKKYFKEAQKAIEGKYLQSLDLDESVRTDLESLVNSFKAEMAQERQIENIRERRKRSFGQSGKRPRDHKKAGERHRGGSPKYCSLL